MHKAARNTCLETCKCYFTVVCAFIKPHFGYNFIHFFQLHTCQVELSCVSLKLDTEHNAKVKHLV